MEAIRPDKLSRRTKLIHDNASANPKYTGMLNGAIGICRSEGIGGIYRGLVPTVRIVSRAVSDRTSIRTLISNPNRCADYETRSEQHGTVRVVQCPARRCITFQANGQQIRIERDVCGRRWSGIDNGL